MISTGVNRPKELLLEKDGIQAHAIFRYQSDIQEGLSLDNTDGTDENFRDRCFGEIAAYKINRLLGLNN